MIGVAFFAFSSYVCLAQAKKQAKKLVTNPLELADNVMPCEDGTGGWSRSGDTSNPTLNPEKIEERRRAAAAAAEARSKKFSQGGGGERLKAKAKALEQAEKKNRDLNGGPTLKWTV